MKKCTKCLEEKELTEFYKHKAQADGLRSWCIMCIKNQNKSPQKKAKQLEYYLKNKDKKKEYNKIYFKKNKQTIIERNNQNRVPLSIEKRKLYYQNRKRKGVPIDKSYRKLYKEKNADKIKQKAKEYRINNLDKIKLRTSEWIKNNKSRVNECNRKNNKIKRTSNPIFKLAEIFRGRTNIAFSKKNYKKGKKTELLLGCSFEFAKTYIERQFKKGMNWDNHGINGWHLDHIIPLASAKTEDELRMLCHYTNLQPLWAKDNLKKKDKILNTQIKMCI